MRLTLISTFKNEKTLSYIFHGLTGTMGFGRNTLAVENRFSFIILKKITSYTLYLSLLNYLLDSRLFF